MSSNLSFVYTITNSRTLKKLIGGSITAESADAAIKKVINRNGVSIVSEKRFSDYETTPVFKFRGVSVFISLIPMPTRYWE